MKVDIGFILSKYPKISSAYTKLLPLRYKVRYLLNYRKANPKINYNNLENVIFIAHPDDELLLMGDYLFCHSSSTLVVCLTNGGNITRLNEFSTLMSEMNIQYLIWNFRDGDQFKWNQKRAKYKINKIIQKKEWAKVITHNREGDYGHFQHKQVYNLVKSVYHGSNLFVTLNRSELSQSKYALSLSNYKQKCEIFKRYYKSQESIVTVFADYFKYEGIVRDN